ncbi:phosphatidate cytidylyltransferase [Anaeromyxobacter sp. Fw109-5]|uniref:phosphatidate cytidylyltransferase n=1 Tax=Anaeromyxobacter sp. (strain Fw109-5) TaxID=404589 RepID=UPI000158A826|nr:phosphatidate cytidylyltransferase [Anaeromyxobacter sp. Fw109-5]ABS27884.1 phosphatidate cytidylyltransferase [Anaeromyxobacter sp. Fw109-5]
MGALDPKNRHNLVLRVTSAAVLFPLAVWITYVGGLPFAVLAGGAAAVAAFELVVMFGAVGAAEVFGIAVAAAIPFVAAWEPSGNLLPGWSGLALAGATIVLFVFSLFRRSPLEEVPRAMAVVALSWLYCGVLLASLVGLRLRFDVGWVILAFVVTWGNDTFAYFTGHALGRHKLLERISPKKTWEGFAGGAVGSVLGALVTRALLLEDELSVGLAVAIGLGGALLGPLGDLAESMVKRAAGVKDSGKIIPGHGGLLDRIDALLFVAPWVYVCAAYLR